MAFDVQEVDAGVLAAADDAHAAPERHDGAERGLDAVLRVHHVETFLQDQVTFAVCYSVELISFYLIAVEFGPSSLFWSHLNRLMYYVLALLNVTYNGDIFCISFPAYRKIVFLLFLRDLALVQTKHE